MSASHIALDETTLLTQLHQRDQQAFAALMHRHGPLVWSVCRRMQLTVADAEDVFQATFLVLYQHSHKLRSQSSLSSWLHGVAWRLGMKLKRDAARRRQRLKLAALNDLTEQRTELDPELAQKLDQELGQLPERYRQPLVHCYLLGQSQSQAAAALGWPIGTVSGRLARAKELLRSRLIRQGVMPGLVGTALVEPLLGSLPPGLVERSSRSLAEGGSSSIQQLAQGVFAMSMGMRLLVAGCLVSVLAVATGWGLTPTQEAGKQGDASSPVKPAPAEDHPDYQALQGTWRHENRHEVTGELQSVQDIIFKGKKYAKVHYSVTPEGKRAEKGGTSEAWDYSLFPKKSPKEIELRWSDLSNELGLGGGGFDQFEFYVMQYSISGDVLTMTALGHYPVVNKSGKLVTDRSLPLVKPEKHYQISYRRIPTDNKPAVNNSTSAEGEEKKILEELVKLRSDVFELRKQAYYAGKETMNFVIESIERRVEAQLDLASNDLVAQQRILINGIVDAKDIENVADGKYKAGSSTMLDLLTAREARVALELRLLRLKSHPRGL
jgi:RNA polymerase sigma factor (sigma-70 family)